MVDAVGNKLGKGVYKSVAFVEGNEKAFAIVKDGGKLIAYGGYSRFFKGIEYKGGGADRSGHSHGNDGYSEAFLADSLSAVADARAGRYAGVTNLKGGAHTVDAF